MLELNLKVSQEDFKIIWAALGELPMKAVYGTAMNLRRQVEEQERNHVLGQQELSAMRAANTAVEQPEAGKDAGHAA